MIYLASLTEEIKDKLEGYYFIKTKEELDKLVIDNRQFNKIIIAKDFAQTYFTPSGLNEYLENAKELNRNLVIELDSQAKAISENSLIEKLQDVWTEDDLIYLTVKYPKELLSTVRKLATENMEQQKLVLEASNTVSRLQSIIDNLTLEKENSEYALKIEQGNKFSIQSKLDALVKRINYQYNVKVDSESLFRETSNRFDKVLYFKEITRVQYIDTFVYYLREIFKVLYGLPTRFVVVESYYAASKIPLYPDLVAHHELKERDVLSGDILMLGYQPNLMKDIVKNSSNVSLLIVLDRGGYKTPHLYGNNVEYFYIVSDLKDVSKDIPLSRVISYSEATLFIPHIGEFQSLDNSERMARYSSMGIMKKMIALLEGR